MPVVDGGTALSVNRLITQPTTGLPNAERVGSVTIQRRAVKNDDSTASTGIIYISFPGRHNSNPNNATTSLTAVCSATVHDCYLDSTINSVTFDLGTSGQTNHFIALSQILWTNSVDNEGVIFFTTED